MNRTPVIDALSRLERLLFQLPVLEAFIARREAGEADYEDTATADALVEELMAHQSPDGSWGGGLARTAEALLLVSELRPFQHDVAEHVSRALQWLRSRQRAAGTFTDHCTPERHAFGLCHHRACGFFSPGPLEQSFAGSTLTAGATFPTDADARLGISALALRALLDYERPSIDDSLQLAALLRVAELLFRPSANVSTPAAVSVLCTLARAPRSPGHVAILHNALTRLAGLQRADGSWPGAEGFHVADAFLIAVQAGYGSPLFDKALLRTAEQLMLSQQNDGSWGAGGSPQRLLIGWRALRYAAGISSTRTQLS